MGLLADTGFHGEAVLRTETRYLSSVQPEFA